MVEIQTLIGYLTPISITIGVIYHILTLNNTRKNQQLILENRQAQLLLQLNRTFTEKEAIKDFHTVWTMQWDNYEDFLRKYDSEVNFENFLSRYRIYCIYDIHGQLLKHKLIDPEIIYPNFGPWSITLWEKHGPIINEWRKERNIPILWSGLEYLAGEMQKIREKMQQSNT